MTLVWMMDVWYTAAMAAAPRRGGLGGQGTSRARQNIFRPGQASKADEALFGPQDRGPAKHLMTAWEFPDSSRVRAYQYDYTLNQLRVRFIKYNTPWVYNNVTSTLYESFAAASSKGKFINSTLNFTDHRRASAQEESEYFTGV